MCERCQAIIEESLGPAPRQCVSVAKHTLPVRGGSSISVCTRHRQVAEEAIGGLWCMEVGSSGQRVLRFVPRANIYMIEES